MSEKTIKKIFCDVCGHEITNLNDDSCVGAREGKRVNKIEFMIYSFGVAGGVSSWSDFCSSCQGKIINFIKNELVK